MQEVSGSIPLSSTKTFQNKMLNIFIAEPVKMSRDLSSGYGLPTKCGAT